MNKQDVVNALVDAITGSGKKFAEISKDAVFGFLKREGVSQKDWDSIYEELSDVYQPKKKKKQPSNDNAFANNIPVVNYECDAHNEVKKRQPRKTIFSEITKIAG